MTKMVLSEFDHCTFEMFSDRTMEQIAKDQLALIGPGSRLGIWLKDNGIKAHYTVLTNQTTQIHKFVIYAELSDIQQTDYALRF